MARRLMALIVTALATFAIASTATAHGATVFYTGCDAVSDTDTVKVKKIEEDGSGAATVADTTITYCGSGAPSRYLTGLAIHDGYAYFSWLSSPIGTSTGIGRVGLDGKNLNLDFIAGPAGSSFLRINSAVHEGYLHAYIDDGAASTGRVDRVPIAGGSFSAVVPATGTALSFGIANGSVYYASDETTLYRSGLDGSNRGEVVFNSFGGGGLLVADPWITSGTGATLVAGSASTLFILSSNSGSQSNWEGISTLTPASTPTTLGRYSAVPLGSGVIGNPMAWSGSHLYFVQADNNSIGRVKEDGTGLDRAWTSSARVLELAIGSMPAAAPAATPPAVKPTLKTTTIKKQTLYRMVNKLPETTVECATSNDQALGSCTVEITTTANALRKGKATKAKRVVIGKATTTATAGSTTISVKVRITNTRARTILMRGGTLKATIKITATSTASQTSTASKATTLKAAKKKGKAAYRR